MERLWRVRSRVSSRGDFTRGTNEGASRPSESVGEGVALLLCGWGWGLKGAGLSTNPGDVSTGASEASEARCESREARVRGLSGPAGLRSTARKPRPARRLRLAAVLALGLRSLRRGPREQSSLVITKGASAFRTTSLYEPAAPFSPTHSRPRPPQPIPSLAALAQSSLARCWLTTTGSPARAG